MTDETQYDNAEALATSMTRTKKGDDAVVGELKEAIERGCEWLYRNQHEEGFWVGALESNSCMEAEWLLAMYFLGVEGDPKYEGVVRSILNEQRSDGSWEIYYGAPDGDINSTVECYAALRSAGMSPQSEPLRKARRWIVDHGGLNGIRVFTKFWLALIGEWPWTGTPTLPPELIFLPSWFPLNIYRFSSWSRATIIPLSILSARRPVRKLPVERRLDELFPDGRDKMDYSIPRKKRTLSWEGFFLLVDRLLRAYVKSPLHPGRETAVKVCIEWIIKHQEADGAWSGIQPPWVYSLMALNVEGYPLEHPVMASGLRALDAHWSYERNGGIYIQASESPVWDTLLSMLALIDCGKDFDKCPALEIALSWILSQQVTIPGDWEVRVRGVRSGGWAFERENDLYPDVDDTAVALVVLGRLREWVDDTTEIDRAIELATEWTLGMQCSNGGWAAFDRDNDSQLVTRIPFSDFGEALDPPSVDVTAHVLEGLAMQGRGLDDPAVTRAVQYMNSEQEPEGSWFGRWGVNHIYGTGAVLPALRAVGEDMSADYVRRAADWIVRHQNPDGGWGETCASYMDDTLRGVGESTASQTAWAIIGLLAVGAPEYGRAIGLGVEYLIRHQAEGTWDEPQYTGCGFPGYALGARIDLEKRKEQLEQGVELSRGFMINYNLYRHYFPLIALGRALTHFKERFASA